MKNLRRFHDPQYNHLVEKAHDFMAGTLGLDVTTPDKMAVIPHDKKYALKAVLGRPVTADGEYFHDDRDLYVIADGLRGDLDMRETNILCALVHELGHDYTARSRRARKAHTFTREALAGMAEAKLRDELVLQGERRMPEATVVVQGLTHYLSGRYYNQDEMGRVWRSQGSLAACALSLASQVSGITEDEIWAAASGRRARHIDLAEDSLEALGSGTVRNLDRFPRNQQGTERAAVYVETLAVNQGAQMEDAEAFYPYFPAQH